MPKLSDAEGFDPAHMLDQSHNVTDPIESLMLSAVEVQRAYAQALLVDRKALEGFQDGNDALMATQTLKTAFRTDVEPILAMARLQAGGAIDPVAAYRARRLPRQGRRGASGGRWPAAAASFKHGSQPISRSGIGHHATCGCTSALPISTVSLDLMTGSALMLDGGWTSD